MYLNFRMNTGGGIFNEHTQMRHGGRGSMSYENWRSPIPNVIDTSATELLKHSMNPVRHDYPGQSSDSSLLGFLRCSNGRKGRLTDGAERRGWRRQLVCQIIGGIPKSST